MRLVPPAVTGTVFCIEQAVHLSSFCPETVGFPSGRRPGRACENGSSRSNIARDLNSEARLDIQPLRGITTVAFILLGLSACTPASFPLKITDVTAKPDPVVGKVITLEVEIQSSEDEEDVILQIVPPDAVQLMDGDLTWHGSLRAGEPVQHGVSLCVLYPGDWRIYVGAYSMIGDETKYADSDTVHFISTSEAGQAVPGYAYSFSQDPPVPLPSPTPLATPATCS
jgi:hypothetical protein